MKQEMDIDLDQLKKTLAHDGAVVLPNFFRVEELADVNHQLDTYAAEPVTERASELVKKTYTDVQSWQPVENGIPCFIELLNHQRLRALTEALIGEGYQSQESLVMLTRKGKAQAWHQDTASEKEGEFIVNRLIYTRDTPRAAGALVFVPGSHRQGQIPSGGPQDMLPGERIIEPKAGTLALVHSRCFHRVTQNTTDLPRFSINFRVRPETAPPNLTGVGVYRTTKWDFREGKAV